MFFLYDRKVLGMWIERACILNGRKGNRDMEREGGSWPGIHLGTVRNRDGPRGGATGYPHTKCTAVFGFFFSFEGFAESESWMHMYLDQYYVK